MNQIRKLTPCLSPRLFKSMPCSLRRASSVMLLLTCAISSVALSAPPSAPAYDQTDAWLALPGRPGLERSSPSGMAALSLEQADADVFFIHPTTFKGSAVMNAAYDASEFDAPLTLPVLLGQASVFNGCCRIYAPQYRQASLAGLKSEQAVALAYDDVARAFRYFIAHLNQSRPFIIASHSQGTTLAVRLLQQEVLQTSLQRRLVAAYLIGGYVPSSFVELGLPTCDAGRQIGCVISYNTSEAGRASAHRLMNKRSYWWQGRVRTQDKADAICVNPLTWRQQGSAPPEANGGSLPLPKPPFARQASTLDPLLLHLTGAQCRGGMLEIELPWSAPAGFRDELSFLTGSYHLNDYGLFYDSLWRNAAERVNAWHAEQGSVPLPSDTPMSDPKWR